MRDAAQWLRDRGIQITPQRLAVAAAVVSSTGHPTADQVFARARRRCPSLSRATVYNTLNLLVKRKVVRTQVLKEGKVMFDANMGQHHHFVDDEDGTIIDIPWEWLSVEGRERLKGFEVRECQVIVRGRRRK
jgi:Fe2+ or Zn2+ uptake regulation protein